MASNDNNSTADIPQHDPSKPMNSKQEVQNSPDPKTDQDFPGYPHYPAKEDIMAESTGGHRVDANVEEMGTGTNASGVDQRYLAGQDAGSNDALDGNNEEIGLPHNVTNDDRDNEVPGTDIEEAAEKGSLNP
jgi:hypothetical protein